jgi:aryl-alcohol dehydrogenase-like predicted oxidoreductase
MGARARPLFPVGERIADRQIPQGPADAERHTTIRPRLSARFANEQNVEVVERLAAFCAQRGRTMLELAFGWLLARPFVASVIAGATAPEQVRQNADALGWQLTADEIAAVDQITAR